MNTQKGKFIVIEGGDGAGKGACFEFVRSLCNDGSFVYTREPGGTDVGGHIRSILLEKEMSAETELLLFFADRAEHMKRVVEPALSEGRNVLSDRFALTTYAYQIMGRERPHLEDVYHDLYARFVAPSVEPYYIFLDVDPAIGRQRVLERKGKIFDRLDRETLDFHARAREGYLRALRSMPEERYTIIDTMALSEEQTKLAALEAVRHIIAG
jgi:dTMP kinase